MENKEFVKINGMKIPIEGERNLLELIRKAKVDLPTFCYHSELSIYGACRLCVVDINGRGVNASCSIKPVDGMEVNTNTEELREMRKISLELLLASHDNSCTTCIKNSDCKLRTMADKLGVQEIRFKKTKKNSPLDKTSPIERNPNKCILCGDCVRYCKEVQGIGAIDFAYRGSDCVVQPAFGKNLGEVECVYCGQCARVCPTGAINVRSDVDEVWKHLSDKNVNVYFQFAPAVRVALGEMFGMPDGGDVTGRLITCLRMMGADKVYDTSFSADLTVFEESKEFLARVENKGTLPLMTSCCPAWVKYTEHNFSDLLGNLSSCKSPQGMLSSIIKDQNQEDDKRTIVVSIMPCSAKKFEATRDELKTEKDQDTDIVITTKELGQMIKEAGYDFPSLSPSSADLPLGFKTGGGVIFGNSGGVSEAVLRFVKEKLNQKQIPPLVFEKVRGNDSIRETSIEVDGLTVNLAVVHGLSNAKKVCEEVRQGKSKYHIIEVMACPNGCVGGAGQPVPENMNQVLRRKEGLYQVDMRCQLHNSQDNVYVQKVYEQIEDPKGEKVHHLLHTKYQEREI